MKRKLLSILFIMMLLTSLPTLAQARAGGGGSDDSSSNSSYDVDFSADSSGDIEDCRYITANGSSSWSAVCGTKASLYKGIIFTTVSLSVIIARIIYLRRQKIKNKSLENNTKTN